MKWHQGERADREPLLVLSLQQSAPPLLSYNIIQNPALTMNARGDNSCSTRLHFCTPSYHVDGITVARKAGE
eukprot:4575110-Pyramimonas_sp.AAC.1